MNVRQLIDHLSKLEPEAEVMIDAPFCCSKGPSYQKTGSLSLPVRALRTGTFPTKGTPWVIVQGTDAWGLDHGIETR